MATTEPVPPAKYGVVLEPGEKVDRPWQPGDPLEIPETTWKSATRSPLGAALGTDPQEALARLRRVPRAANEPLDLSPPPPELSPEQQRLDDLRSLARWCPPTANVQAVLVTCEARIAEYAERAKKTPPALLAERDRVVARLAECERRDQIQATRPEGCRCLGAGGYGPTTYLTVSEPGDPLRGIPPRVVYSEGVDGPLVHSERCDVCPEGLAYRTWISQELLAMRRRGEASRHQRLLGRARIPKEYERHTLDTYPDQAIAWKVRQWYLSHLGEVPAPSTRALRPWLYLHGPNRRGKTGLAIGVLKLALERGIEGVFRTMPDLLDELRATFDKANPASHADLLDALKTVPLLILDDLGAERLTEGASWVSETIYSLLNARHLEHELTIVTSNLGWSETPRVQQRRQTRPDLGEWHADDWEAEAAARYLGERIWWRVDQSADRLRLIGPPLATDDAPPILKVDDDDPDHW